MKFCSFKSLNLLQLVLTILVLGSVVLLNPLTPQSALAAGTWYVAPGGSDANDCLGAATACATINGALAKSGFLYGDIIRVAIGTYTGTGNEVVLVSKNATLSGGWDSAFTTQNGMATIDGSKSRRGITVSRSVTIAMDHFVVQNGLDPNFGGGGIYIDTGNLSVSNSNIINNGSFSPRYGQGGGIKIGTGTLTLKDSVVSGNHADLMGGGILIGGGSATITNSTISGNTSGISGYSGGGGGGGIENYNSTLVLNNSTVSGNTLLGWYSGSGIDTSGSGGITVNNSTISGNSGGNGAGVSTFASPVSINSSTIANNQYVGVMNTGGSVTLQNTIIAHNGVPLGSDCSVNMSYPSVTKSLGYNLIQKNDQCPLTSTDLVNVDPNIGPLQGNGGPTLTHALLSGSPAIDAGNPAGCAGSGSLLITDQRGYPRAGRCDIGAYEVQDSTPPVIAPTVTPLPNANGWNNSDVTVSWSVSDPESGIASSTGCGTQTLTNETLGVTLTCSATNGAGLSASQSVTIKIDKTPPLMAVGLRMPNPNGWYNTDVTVRFSGVDFLSGVASCTAPVILSTEGQGLSASGTCTDKAGNESAPATASNIQIDKTKPKIEGKRSPLPNEYGWNNTDVVASFTCAETGSVQSGIDANTVAGATVTSEGRDQSVTNSGACTDKAGNSADPSTVGGINIDKTAPSIAISAPVSGGAYLLSAALASAYTCSDGLSGVGSCAGPVPNGTNFDTSAQGPHAFTVEAADLAGNTSSATSNYNVIPSATLQILAALHTVGSGTNPGSIKTPQSLQIKVFDKAVVGSPDPKDFGSIWGSPNGVITPTMVSAPSVVNVGGGQANLYSLLVPAADPNNGRGGSYLIIGKATVDGVDVYVGSSTNALATNSVTQTYLQIIKNANGKIIPAQTTAIPGSLLLIVEPAYLEFTSNAELLPIVYDSVDGTWSATVRADPPEGFVSNPGALTVDVSTGQLQAVQFTLTDVGSQWTSTTVTHHLKHNGKDSTVRVSVGMINHKPAGVVSSTQTPAPSVTATRTPTPLPTKTPTAVPSSKPKATPTSTPTAVPTKAPPATATPTLPKPSATPTSVPTRTSTASPTSIPTKAPTLSRSPVPPKAPSPTSVPTKAPAVPATTFPAATPPGKPKDAGLGLSVEPTTLPTSAPPHGP